eukprot:6465536-Amphidinium_carterae.2
MPIPMARGIRTPSCFSAYCPFGWVAVSWLEEMSYMIMAPPGVFCSFGSATFARVVCQRHQRWVDPRN